VEDVLSTAAAATDAVCVVTGPEEALRRLAVRRLVGQAAGQDITVVSVSAGDSGAATTIEHACEPTLFGGATWLLITELDTASDEGIAAAKMALASASPDLRVILAHSGAARGKAVLNAAEKAGGRVIEVRPVAASALVPVMSGHARQAGAVLTSEAAAAIIAALGQDLTTLLSCVEQLASDAPAGTIDLDLVRTTLVAAGTDNQFEIADLVWHRRTHEALVAFRQLAERNGAASACVTVVAALSYSLRSLARYVAERPSGSPWQVASALGVPTWKLDGLAAQSKLWRPGQLAAAAVALADADAGAKGGLGDAGALDPEQKMYAVERLIGQLSTT
jgi:DNA polymerase-3 subunit delta